ncbi:ArdC family protein [Tenacibaculum piscium]|uniref:ArdC family protein n=1 Tax=Tenacibaculum piscium TaxID=1458515 RepID=UPI001EEC0A83|nr:zincin-like metallopeptidase domain-containing protein [Tenacibaculum piscium]
MTIQQQFKNLNGSEVTRKQLERIIANAKRANETEIVYRLSKILLDNKGVDAFDISLRNYPTALAGSRHKGAYKEALTECGRLRKGWKFSKGGVFKVATLDKKTKQFSMGLNGKKPCGCGGTKTTCGCKKKNLTTNEDYLQISDLEGLGLPFIANPETVEDPTALGKPFTNDDIYQMITDKMISLVEKSTGKGYVKKWGQKEYYEKDGFLIPINFVSKNAYRGVNPWMLKDDFLAVMDNPYFMTFKQIKEKKGKLKKGSKGTPIVYFTLLYKFENPKTKKEFGTYDKDRMMKYIKNFGHQAKDFDDVVNSIAILKYYNVFNGSDIEEIDFKLDELQLGRVVKSDESLANEKNEIAELIVTNYPKPAPTIKHGGNKAYHQEANDLVQMPRFQSFDTPNDYYRTLFHELTHSTGNKKRLARKLGNKFGSKEYAKEELIAEFGAVFLSAQAGIIWHTNKNHAEYLKGWSGMLKIAKEDNKFLMRGASAAQKASDFVLNLDANNVPAFHKELGKIVSTKKTATKKTASISDGSAYPVAIPETKKTITANAPFDSCGRLRKGWHYKNGKLTQVASKVKATKKAEIKKIDKPAVTPTKSTKKGIVFALESGLGIGCKNPKTDKIQLLFFRGEYPQMLTNSSKTNWVEKNGILETNLTKYIKSRNHYVASKWVDDDDFVNLIDSKVPKIHIDANLSLDDYIYIKKDYLESRIEEVKSDNKNDIKKWNKVYLPKLRKELRVVSGNIEMYLERKSTPKPKPTKKDTDTLITFKNGGLAFSSVKLDKIQFYFPKTTPVKLARLFAIKKYGWKKTDGIWETTVSELYRDAMDIINEHTNKNQVKYQKLTANDITEFIDKPAVKKKAKTSPKDELFSKEDIPYQLAYDAHRGTSFDPEKRAVSHQNEYYNTLKDTYEVNYKKAIKLSVEDDFEAKFIRFKNGYLNRYLAYLRSKNGMMSTMITGASNFPVARMRKKSDAIDKKLNELVEFVDKYDNFFKAKAPSKIKTGSADALEKLNKKLIDLEEQHSLMKKGNAVINKVLRKKGLSRDAQIKEITIGFEDFFKQKTIEAWVKLNKDGSSIKSNSFYLTNLTANIREVKKQIVLEKRLKESSDEKGNTEIEFENGTIIINREINKFQILFDGKPDADVRAFLKKAGHAFKWSPTNGVWQRQLNTYYRGNIDDLYAFLGVEVNNPPTKKAKTVEKPAVKEVEKDVFVLDNIRDVLSINKLIPLIFTKDKNQLKPKRKSKNNNDIAQNNMFHLLNDNHFKHQYFKESYYTMIDGLNHYNIPVYVDKKITEKDFKTLNNKQLIFLIEELRFYVGRAGNYNNETGTKHRKQKEIIRYNINQINKKIKLPKYSLDDTYGVEMSKMQSFKFVNHKNKDKNHNPNFEWDYKDEETYARNWLDNYLTIRSKPTEEFGVLMPDLDRMRYGRYLDENKDLESANTISIEKNKERTQNWLNKANKQRGLAKPRTSLSGNSLASKLANRQNKVAEFYKIQDENISEFLGKIEVKQKESVVITLTGGQGSMKTRCAFRFINAFAQNYKVGHASIEEHPESTLYWNKVHEYILDKAMANISNPEIKSIADLDQLIKANDVIVIDSFAKLQEIEKGFEVDKDLRKKYDGKIFIVIFQQTTDGKMRGGSKSQFDGDVILFTQKFDDYQENYIYADKNRYQNKNLSDLKYNIFEGILTVTE